MGTSELRDCLLQACKGISGEAYKAMSNAEASAGAGAGQLPASPSPAPEQDAAEEAHAQSARYGPWSGSAACHAA